ncbi:MAG: pilus assembly protein, partial [Nitrospiraceae bacterium]
TTYANNTVAMVNAIDASHNQGNTPMAETLYEAGRYYAQIGSAFHTGFYVYPDSYSPGVGLASTGPGSLGTGELSALTGSETCPAGYISNACGRDPYFLGSNHTPMWASPSAQAPCCESFVIIFTDGDSQQDTLIPAALQDLADAYHGTHCTTDTSGAGASPPNPPHAVHAANGLCNDNPATPTATLLKEHKTDFANSGQHYLDDVAYWMHIRDLRQATIPDISEAGHDLAGFQNVTVYAFFAFAQMTNREFLLQTAKQGGFEDLNGNNVPDCDTVVLTNPCEWDRLNNATGAAGRDNIPDTYFESSDVAEMKTKLALALASILQRTTSGTSLSVLATSTTGEGALYQSFFFPKITEGLTTVYWIGFTQALFLDTFGNLREDTNGDGRLVYKDDKIIRTRYDSATGAVKVDLFTDTSPSPDGDGQADSTTPSSTVELKDIKPLWEAGKNLAVRDTTSLPRKVLTWLDLNNNGIVDSSEELEFKSASPDNSARIQPYVRAATSTEAVNIIQWIRGETVAGYRNRERTVGGTLKTWRYGDTIHSTPTVVAAPRERFDVLYGDISYSAFFQAYKDRRQVSYVGANDGMLHAFNVGFYNAGDDPTTTTAVEHGWFTTQKVTAPFVSNVVALGHELWAFIPQELLPQLKFLTQTNYQHVYYVDQKPKITDARIFCDGTNPATSPNCVTGQASASHPNGWGTILIGAYRLGGSCLNCNTGATDLSVTADFNYDGDTVDAGDTRKFRSAYFVLDITDPERDPKLLWVFTDNDLGLTLGYPTMVRLRPTGGDKTDNSDARWFVVAGSGPTGYDVGSVQTGKVFVVDLIKYAAARTLNTTYYVFPTPNTCGVASPNSECSVIGNIVTVDTDFDYRGDVLYFGNTTCNATSAPCNGNMGSGSPAAPTWKGRLYRITTGSSTKALGTETDPCNWGIGSAACARTPSILLNDFACTGACVGATKVGPVNASPNIAQDDGNRIWVYWGTGRYFATADKINADQQHFFGVKDPVPTSGCTQTATANSCEKKDLVNVSNAEICVIGTTTGSGTCTATSQVTGVTGLTSGTGGYDTSSGTSNTLQSLIQSKDGWFTTLPDARERALSSPTIIGGLVFFPTYVPTNDICSTSGSSFLYALYYKSGTAYKESVVGTEVVGANTNIKRRSGISDPGMASGVAIHIGAQGSGANGTGGGGCQGQLTANIQSSTGSVGQTCLKTAGAPWSYYISWVSQRE